MEKPKIATIGSHTALQILKGARDEGFSTIAVCTEKHAKVYKNFGVADEIIIVDSYKDFPLVEEELVRKNAIIIPHGSFIAYMGEENVQKMKPKYYGNKGIIHWESDRHAEKEWLTKAGLKVPRLSPMVPKTKTSASPPVVGQRS